MGKTIAENILSNHCGLDVRAGDIAICDVDFCFGQDGTSSIIIDSFKKLGVNKVFDKEKFRMVIDHSAPSPNIGVSEIHKKMREAKVDLGDKALDLGKSQQRIKPAFRTHPLPPGTLMRFCSPLFRSFQADGAIPIPATCR